MVSRNFAGNNFFSFLVYPLFFSGILARFGLRRLEKFRARAENTKVQFRGAKGPFWPPQKFLETAQLFYVFYFGRPDPRGEKWRNTGLLGHFGLGQPLALQRRVQPVLRPL